MKTAKKALSLFLCALMLSATIINDGWNLLIPRPEANAMAGHEQNYKDTRIELDFNKNWSFSLTDDDAAYLKGYDDSSWEKVDIPHDFSISQNFTDEGTSSASGNLPGGTGWYRKWFNLYEYLAGERVILNFDGAYQHAYVYVNGKYVGENHYGYNSFSFEIADYLIFSNTALNLIAVKVVNDLPSSRWYSGSGINRDVTLTIAGPVHVSLYGPRITTPNINTTDEPSDNAGRIEAKVKLHNCSAIARKVTVETSIIDTNHNNLSGTEASAVVPIDADKEITVTLNPSIESPELWSPDNPKLYILKTIVKDENGELIDEYHTTFGFRKVEWSADNGFIINGKPLKLKGVSLHHDQGALGAVQEYDAIYRQIVTLKEMGCNAIRTTHNPASQILIDICNKLGMLVIEEFFDGWDASKDYNTNDFSRYFNETISADNKAIGAKGQKWFQYVIEHTILRDEHAPCVIAWDVGNELCNITDGETTENYAEIAESIYNICKEIDPSRVILQGNNKPENDVTSMIDEKMDVIGGNYSPEYWQYVLKEKGDPRSTKPFVATEAASATNSRGVYYTMGTDQENKQLSSYDTVWVDWGNSAAEAWYYTITNDWFSGEFIWTGFDYIGEPTPWNNYSRPNENAVPNSSYFGVVDTAGFTKDSYYLYRSLWNENSTTLHLVPGTWNRNNLYIEDGYVNVAVYSNADKIELLLNGNVIAESEATVNTTTSGFSYLTWEETAVNSSVCNNAEFYSGKGSKFYSQFKVKYEEGTLSVRAYDTDGNLISDTVGTSSVTTATASVISAKTWQNRNTFVADSADFIYVEFEALDEDGNFINDYNGLLEIKVDDSSSRYAKIIGVDNGNPATTEKFQQESVISEDASSAVIQMFNGKALVILKTTDEEGTVNFTAVASDGSSDISAKGVTITTVKETGTELTDELEEVIKQTVNKYEVTLYDEYELTKYHINNLEPPVAGGNTDDSDDTGDTTPDVPPESDGNENKTPENYEIYLPDTSEILSGDFVIYNQQHVLSTDAYDTWALKADNNLYDKVEAASDLAYNYESFNTSYDNVYSFIPTDNNTYYIKNNSTGKYYTINNLNDYPAEFNIEIYEDGSINIISVYGYYVVHYGIRGEYFGGANTRTDYPADHLDFKMWLFKPNYSKDEIPTTPPAEDEDETEIFEIYLPDDGASDGCIPDGRYVINNDTLIMKSATYDNWNVMIAEKPTQNVTLAENGSLFDYESFSTSDDNVFEFTHQGQNIYHIRNAATGKYFNITKSAANLTDTPQPYKVNVHENGSVSIINLNDVYLARYYYDTSALYFCGELTGGDYNENHPDLYHWLYKSNKEETEDENTDASLTEKKVLYDILFEGIEIDYSQYSRESFETLLRALEDGVAVYTDPSSADQDFSAATEKIRAAINGLIIDVKKIKGTLFKYGYDNSTGTPDYSDGGILMNQITVERMKNAILADENLVNQIKDIIGYDNPAHGWTDNRADEAVAEVAEGYARIYSLMFTGRPTADSPIANGANTWEYLPYNSGPQATLWNLWTKDNTHGANDPVLSDGPVYDGASVQGLAGSSLEKGVITSHSAYPGEISYANDGHTDNYDIKHHYYDVFTGTKTVTVQMDYLSGISVYFPDVFTRESLDADGNVTGATSGQFAKYYWDADFPIFISTDQYGVNTYHFDSKDTNFVVQSEFDDANHKVDMELTEVGYWDVIGSTSKSGFFPFNYQQDKSTGYTGENAIYHYGFTFEHNFYIPKSGKHVNGNDVIFNFSGDDDVYVYIDGVLVLDNGGLHGAREVTINFTKCTINYQYAMDVTDGILKGNEYELTYSYNEYFLNPDSCDYNEDTIAALNKLHSIISDGQVHTLNFFYLERGSSDSNCKMSFNLSETSEEVRIIDQDLTLDYGLPVEYNIQENNNLSEAALENGVQVEYIGLCAVNEDVSSTYTFELPEIIVPFEKGVTYTIDGMKYGTCTIDKEGNTRYVLHSMNMTESEHFYVCAKITGDPTYAEAVTYYQIEKTTFIPATTIYYEDTYETITYTDGKVPDNYDNTANKYGLWQTEGEQLTTLKQSADLIDSEANPYGYETNYMSFAEFSGGSIHYVDVSTKNNPNKKYSGGEGAEWPTVDFTFTGTGFDLISITDNTTGAFSVTVRDAETDKIVRNTVVDTFYGYNYGRIYADKDGKPSLDSTLTPMYRSEKGTCTSDERYYDKNGALTDVPHYYDEYDNIVEAETDRPAFAYAYGWVIATDNSTETLYQIPVIKITDLEYSRYSVTITPTFTSAFGHASVNVDNTQYYRVYLDAIKIYSPAGAGDGVTDEETKNAYATDDENYPDYLELKNMLIGAESLSETEGQGIIFIDGIAALDNDLEKYKNAGPNNELYLANGQAVAFEIWATSVPTDIQLGAKLACGSPTLTVSYAAKTSDIVLNTAHDTYYSLNTFMPNDAKLTWHLTTGADGNKYYTTGTVVIQNNGSEDSVLSVTNLKWTFSQNGGKGYFRIPTSVEDEFVSVNATRSTPAMAYSLMRMRTADLDIEQSAAPEITTKEDGSSLVTVRFDTSSDVASLVITDDKGNNITPVDIERLATELDGREVTQWTVTISADAPGTYIYTVSGAYENGYIDDNASISVTVSVEAPPTTEPPEEELPDNNNDEEDEDIKNSIFLTIIGFYQKILEFFRALFALFGVNI